MSQVKMVSPALIKEWYDAGEAVIVDVREPDEWGAEHIPGAHLVPLSAFDPAKVIGLAEAGKKLVFHCRSGARCGMAAQVMLANGFTGEINRMEGGISFGWRQVGGPVESGK